MNMGHILKDTANMHAKQYGANVSEILTVR